MKSSEEAIGATSPSAGQNEQATSGIQPLPGLSPLQLAEAAAKRFETELKALQTEHAGTVRELATAKEKLSAIDKSSLLVALYNMDAGAVLEEADENLNTVVEAVERLGGKGKFTLAFTVKQLGSDGSLVITHELKTVVPKPEPQRAIFYRGEDGGLTRNNPKQKEFKFSRGDRSATNDEQPYRDEERRR